jgi:type II secretory pathway component PulJ
MQITPFKKSSSKGAIILDTMMAIIFFAIVSAGFFKLLYQGGDSIEQLDKTAEESEYMKSVMEYVRNHTCINGNCACPTIPSDFDPPEGVEMNNICSLSSVDKSEVTLIFQRKNGNDYENIETVKLRIY